MSFSVVREKTLEFLRSPDPAVLCIRGKWGTGKTYLWENSLAEASAKAGGVELDSYAYVSLFGIADLNDLKGSIFAATKPIEKNAEITPNVDPSWFAKFWTWIEGIGRKNTKVAGGFAGNKWSEVIQNIYNFAIKNQIVCFDDLERSDLSLSLILGTASMLKERRDCKVIIILNNESLENEDKKLFEKYFEKVVDLSLTLEPKPQEAVELIFDKKSIHYDLIQASCEKLNLTNIRLLQKIQIHISNLTELLKNHDDSCMAEGIKNIIMFSSAYHEPDNMKMMRFIEKTLAISDDKQVVLDVENADEELDEYENSLIMSFEFPDNKFFSRAVLQGITRGYFRVKDVKTAADELQESRKSGTVENTRRQAWDKFHNDWNANEDDIVDEIYTTHYENLDNLSISNLNSALRLLEDFGWSAEKENLLKSYFAYHSNNLQVLSLRDIKMWGDEIDFHLQAAVNEELRKSRDQYDPIIEIQKLALGSYSESQVELLISLEVDDYVKAIKGYTGNRSELIRSLLRFKNSNSNQKIEAHLIAENTERALKLISRESKLMESRVRRYLPA